MDLERILEALELGQETTVERHLNHYNHENFDQFFFNPEEREKRKQRELEEFKCKKYREYVPDSDSGSESDLSGDPDVKLRKKLGYAVMDFLSRDLQPSCQLTCLETVRILSRDRHGMRAFSSLESIHTLARYAGIEERGREEEEEGGERRRREERGETEKEEEGETGKETGRAEKEGEEGYREETGGEEERGEGEEEEEEEEERVGCPVSEEQVNSEAVKALCNIIYNSIEAQEHAARARLLSGLARRLRGSVHSRAPPGGQFFDLRLMFLLTGLRPELRETLAREENGVILLTDSLENALCLRWGDTFEVLMDKTSPPIGKEESERAMEILKILFNITFKINKTEVEEEDAILYRHLAAILRHCILAEYEGEGRREEVQGHAVNLLSNLPLSCLDVLLSARPSPLSSQFQGMNMDCVEALLQFMDHRIERDANAEALGGGRVAPPGSRKGVVTPILNLLTESSRVHRETRKYLRMQILPPLCDVHTRPEVGSSLRNKLVRLMTHVDTDIKQCAAELLFVLCKENVSRFIKYTGYGNAAGLLAARGLLAGGQRSGVFSDDEDTDTEEYREARESINPVTGRVEEKIPDPMEGMTEEQKEIEAVKLVGMLNQLSRNSFLEPVGVTADGRMRHIDDITRQTARERLVEEEEEDEEEEPE